MRAVVFSVALLGVWWVAPVRSGGDPPRNPPTPASAELDKALAALLAQEAELKQHYGPDHPELQRVRARIALTREFHAKLGALAPERADLPVVNGPVFVHTTRGDIHNSAVLRDPRVRSIGAKQFLVGVSVKSTLLKESRFEGKTVWIPLDEIGQMVELDEPKPKKEPEKKPEK